MGVEAAVARAGQGGVRAAPAVGEDGAAAAAELLLLAVAGLLLLLGELGLGADVDAPAGEAGGEAGVLAPAPARHREPGVGGGPRGLLFCVLGEDPPAPGGGGRRCAATGG